MKTLVIGDSWASAVEADTGRKEGWPLMMGLAPEMRLGVSGSTAAQWAADKDGWLTRAQDTVADAVIVSLLGNDARAAVSDGQVTADEVAAGLRDMRAVVDAVIRPLTIVLLYADPFCGAQAQARVAVPLLNGAIRWACNGLPVVYAETGAWLTREHFDGRDIHPTRAGHAVIADRMRELIEARCRYEENMTGHPLGDVCGTDCMGECSERFCPSEAVRRRLIGKPKPMQHLPCVRETC